jgi:hypothetical protein
VDQVGCIADLAGDYRPSARRVLVDHKEASRKAGPVFLRADLVPPLPKHFAGSLSAHAFRRDAFGLHRLADDRHQPPTKLQPGQLDVLGTLIQHHAYSRYIPEA